MNRVAVIKYNWTDYIPLFLLVCFSGNPLFTSTFVTKGLLAAYTFGFVLFTFWHITLTELYKTIRHLLLIILIIIIISAFQNYLLGSISTPGIFALVLKIALGYFTLLYYRTKEINPFHLYIKLIAFLTIISLPFFALNYFIRIGVQLDYNNIKSVIFYNALDLKGLEIRNAGNFWEPGAFAGYLIFGLVCIVLQNKKFILGQYRQEAIWIFIGVFSTISTTGYLLLTLFIFIHILQNYSYGKFLMVPVIVLLSIYAYNNLEFISGKIEDQYEEAMEMDKTDVSNTRFGAWNMDFQYIQDQPLTGNGLSNITRYRFHPWVDSDIGHGNGMSNFIVCWGIPFFLLWLFKVSKFTYDATDSVVVGILIAIIFIFILQSEQFLNYPLFLIFYTASAFPLKRFELITEAE